MYLRAKLVGLLKVDKVLASKAFLKAVGARLTLSQAQQELINLIKCIKLGKDTFILIDLKKIFNRLVINYAFKFKKIKVFITLKAYFNNKTSIKVNIINSSINFYLYLYKKTDLKKKH